ncbi:MAG TPA: TonB-dependent receptor plug domain-containing protein [Gammaproteobacteria bacterium]
MKRSAALLIAIALLPFTHARAAELAVTVTQAGDDAVEGVVVSVDNEHEATTGANGQARFELPAGNHAVVLRQGGGRLATTNVALTDDGAEMIVVLRGADLEPQIAVQALDAPPANGSIEEVVATAKYVADSIAIAEQASGSVLEAISAQEISLAGDSNAAAALKRVTGLTITDGSYVYVRGLGERYSSTQFNGSRLASPDSTRRVVPLDLFPAGILRGVTVQKSYSPDMPGEFGGGTVQLVTKTIPDQFFWELGISGSWRDGTTGEDFMTYDGGGRDALGMDDGTRDIPSLAAMAIAHGTRISPYSSVNMDGFTDAELEAIGEQFSKNYDVESATAGPGAGISGAIGDRFALGTQSAWGYLAAFDYGSDWLNRMETRREFTVGAGGDLEVNKESELALSRRSIDLSGFLSLGLELGANHTLASTTALLRQTTDETQVSNGFTRINDDTIRETELEWIERELFIQQFTGEHFLGNFELDWRVSYTGALREEPDTRFYRYDFDPTHGGYLFSTRADGNQRRWEKLDEDAYDYGIDLAYPMSGMSWANELILKGGFAYSDKERNSDIRRFRFFGGNANANAVNLISLPSLEDILVDANIEPDIFEIRDSTRPTDNYSATQEITAGYLMADAYLTAPFRITGGVRVEQNEQRVRTYDVFDPNLTPEIASISNDDILPALSLTWFQDEASQVTFAVSQTVSRPDLKELSRAPYTDDQRDVEVVGNPDLETTDILNVDLRWQWTIDGVDTVSAAAFYKDFTNPIEFVTRPGTDDLVTLANSESAVNYGVELELRRALTFIDDDWSNWFVGMNTTWIESEITLPEDALTVNTNDARPLQGQSPWVVNLQVGFEDVAAGRSAVLLYNAAGERIVEVGTFGAPDIYEQPFHQLDFVYRQRLSDTLDLSVKLGNILDDDVEYAQGNEITRSYQDGRVLSLGVTWTGF